MFMNILKFICKNRYTLILILSVFLYTSDAFAVFEALQGLFGGNDTNGSDIADDTDSEDTENDFARISVFGVMSGTFQ